MKEFSVLTVTKRTGWESIAQRSIQRQTVQPKEWIVVSEQPSALRGLYIPKIYQAPKTDTPSNINKSHNFGLKKIKSPFVIFYQDFIELPPDCFEKLMELAHKHRFVTTCTPNYDGSNDIRYLGVDCPRPCRPEEWETNVALAPMKGLKEVGGFDEELDKGWSWDNVSVALRAEMLGYTFMLDESNRPKLMPHEQTSKLAMEPNGERLAQIMRETYSGERPLKLTYL